RAKDPEVHPPMPLSWQDLQRGWYQTLSGEFHADIGICAERLRSVAGEAGPLSLKFYSRLLRGYTRMTRMTRLSDIVHSDPDILGGTPVFAGSRVPIQSLFDYLEGGETLDEFLRQFPSVGRDQAIAALDLARTTLLAGARPS